MYYLRNKNDLRGKKILKYFMLLVYNYNWCLYDENKK